MEYSEDHFSKLNAKTGDTFYVTIKTEPLKTAKLEEYPPTVKECGNCHAIITREGSCPYCGSLHDAEPMKLPDGEPKMFLVEKATTKPNAPVVIFAVDCSGSMSGHRIEIVKSIILEKMSALMNDNNEPRVTLIAFGSEIIMYGDFNGKPRRYEVWRDSNVEKIIEENKSLLSIRECYGKMEESVKNMGLIGMTAGVTSLLIATGIASQYGGKVEFFTDGKSNKGIDEIEGIPKIKEKLAKGNVVVNIYSFSDHEEFLGPYSPIVSMTGGVLQRLTNDMTETKERVAPALKTEIVGRNVELKVITPECIEYANNFTSKTVTDIRNVILHFTVKNEEQLKEREKVPIQIVMSYLDTAGSKVSLVVEKEFAVTNEISAKNAGMVIRGSFEKILGFLTNKDIQNAMIEFQRMESYDFNLSENEKESMKGIMEDIKELLEVAVQTNIVPDELLTSLSDLTMKDNSLLAGGAH